MAIIDIKVPDIGDFAEVAIIEVLVQPGDTIKAEQSLITVESDKASMEIPSSHAGVVKELRVKLGDKVAEGSVVLTLEVDGAGTATTAAPAAAPASESKPALVQVLQAPAAINTVASGFAGTADLDCDLLVLGGGPGGYSAAFRAADLGLKVVIVERYATLRCVPERGLHPVQGAAACGGRHGRGEPPGGCGHRLWRPHGQCGPAARPQGKGHRQAHRRPGRHGQDA